MKYAFIAEQRTHHSVRRMCRLLRGIEGGVLANEALRAEVVGVHGESRKTYGRLRGLVTTRYSPPSRIGGRRSRRSSVPTAAVDTPSVNMI